VRQARPSGPGQRRQQLAPLPPRSFSGPPGPLRGGGRGRRRELYREAGPDGCAHRRPRRGNRRPRCVSHRHHAQGGRAAGRWLPQGRCVQQVGCVRGCPLRCRRPRRFERLRFALLLRPEDAKGASESGSARASRSSRRRGPSAASAAGVGGVIRLRACTLWQARLWFEFWFHLAGGEQVSRQAVVPPAVQAAWVEKAS
jgi:hypothetical protein